MLAKNNEVREHIRERGKIERLKDQKRQKVTNSKYRQQEY